MTIEPLEQTADGTDDRMRELASLARLVTYARNSAKDLKVESPTYCLDLALGLLLEELSKCGVSDVEGIDRDESRSGFTSGLPH
jgi:hypothetical protein